MTDRICSVPDCDKPIKYRQWCGAHYQKLMKYGDPLYRAYTPNPQPCSVDGCETLAKTRGWCATHYSRVVRHGDPLYTVQYPTACTIDGCLRPYNTAGYCTHHYMHLKRYGDPLAGRTRIDELWGFYLEHVYEPSDGCKLWPYALDKRGYGWLVRQGKRYAVHALACLAWHGPPPPGTGAAHGPCHNPQCWSGAHVSWRTHQENMADKTRDGTNPAGERNPGARLTAEEVLQIRADYASGRVSQKSLSEAYGTCDSNISNIVNGKRWTHLLTQSTGTT